MRACRGRGFRCVRRRRSRRTSAATGPIGAPSSREIGERTSGVGASRTAVESSGRLQTRPGVYGPARNAGFFHANVRIESAPSIQGEQLRDRVSASSFLWYGSSPRQTLGSDGTFSLSVTNKLKEPIRD